MKRITAALAVTLMLLTLAACKAEKTSDSPRPANAPCDRCAPRPTLTPTYDLVPGKSS